MKKYLLFTFIILSLNSIAQNQELMLASDVWPPFTDVEDEKALAMDIVEVALNRINVKVFYEIVEFGDVLEGIASSEYDGSGALWINEERQKTILFSDPYLYNQLILVGRSDSDVSASSFADIAGKSIGVVENYAYGDEVYKENSITVLKGKSDQQNLERLLAKKVDYILVDALLIQYLLKYQVNDVSSFLEIGTHPLIVKPLHLGIEKDHPNAANIIDEFNKEIQVMIAEGVYHEILELNWIRADVDGDGKMELVLNGEHAGENPPQSAYGVNHPDSMSNEGYYINGKHYETWDQVPNDVKVAMPKPEISNYHEGGAIFTF